MRGLSTILRVLPLAMATASMLALAPPAMAEKPEGGTRIGGSGGGNLFDNLFGGGIRYRPRADLPLEESKPRIAVAAPRVTGPSYYDYKADPLVRVDFAVLRAVPEKATFDPSLAGPTVGDMAAGLDGFDLFAEKDVGQALVD